MLNAYHKHNPFIDGHLHRHYVCIYISHHEHYGHLKQNKHGNVEPNHLAHDFHHCHYKRNDHAHHQHHADHQHHCNHNSDVIGLNDGNIYRDYVDHGNYQRYHIINEFSYKHIDFDSDEDA